MPDFSPTPVPEGSIDFAKEIRDAIVGLLESYSPTMVGGTLGVKLVRARKPQPPGSVRRHLPRAKVPALEVQVEDGDDVEGDVLGADFMAYNVTIEATATKADHLSAYDRCARLRDEALRIVLSTVDKRPNTFLASGAHIFRDGSTPKTEPEMVEGDNYQHRAEALIPLVVKWTRPEV